MFLDHNQLQTSKNWLTESRIPDWNRISKGRVILHIFLTHTQCRRTFKFNRIDKANVTFSYLSRWILSVKLLPIRYIVMYCCPSILCGVYLLWLQSDLIIYTCTYWPKRVCVSLFNLWADILYLVGLCISNNKAL